MPIIPSISTMKAECFLTIFQANGQIRINEFRNEEGEIDANLDDSVEVMVEWWDDENEVVVLSKEKAEKVKVWDDIKKRHEADNTIAGFFFGWAYLRSGTVLVPMVLHALGNLVALSLHLGVYYWIQSLVAL